MPDQKISQLNAATAIYDDDDMVVVQDAETKQVNASVVRTYVITGLSKSDVGLGNVDNTSDATKNSATVTLTNKTLKNPIINGFTGDASVINIGSGQIYKDASGNVGFGTVPAAKLDVLGNIRFGNWSKASLNHDGSNQQNINTTGNTLWYNPVSKFYRWHANNVALMTLDASGNLLLTGGGGLGYGTGSGGTVTQATSKSTAVTLNKSCGRIVMNAEALAAGATAAFQVNNSTVATSDNIIATVVGFVGYSVSVYIGSAGNFTCKVTNTTGVSLSEAVFINFAVIKGVTA